MRTIKIASSLDGYALPVLSQKLGVDLAQLEKKIQEVRKYSVIPATDKAVLMHDLERAKLGAEVLGLNEVLKILKDWEKDLEKVREAIPLSFSRYVDLRKKRQGVRSLFTKKLRKRFGEDSVVVFPYEHGKEIPENYEKVEEVNGFILGRVSKDRYVLIGPHVRLIRKKPYYFGKKLLGEWIIERRGSKENS